jgi:hypothetical protein
MRVTGRTIVIAVAVAGALAFVMGWVVTREVRATARRTDARVELLADAIVAHAKSHGGDMPTSEQALRSGLPAGAAADPELEAALRFLQVAWPPDPSLAPILGANGLPTGIGTLPRVNERLRASARGSVPNPAAQVSAPAP